MGMRVRDGVFCFLGKGSSIIHTKRLGVWLGACHALPEHVDVCRYNIIAEMKLVCFLVLLLALLAQDLHAKRPPKQGKRVRTNYES